MKLLWQALSFVVLIVATALVAAVLVIAVDSNISRAFNSFFAGIFGSFYSITEVLVRATPLILAGLGVAVAFQARFFNIGAEGQLYMGAVAATWVGLYLPPLPIALHLALAMASGFLLGGLWALIPGFLKGQFQIPEVINTIMFNYIAINLVGILVRTLMTNPESPLPMSARLSDDLRLPLIADPTRLHGGLIIALICAVIVYFFLYKTTWGFELRAVGINPRACSCAGILVKKNIIVSSLVSGGLAGLAGSSEILGIHQRLMEGISPEFGYVAIIVALLGKNHPLGVVLAALGIAALQMGANTMQRRAGVPASISLIIMGLLVILILARRYFISQSSRETA
jgi:general nucleoside transport system permease protein